MLTEIEFYIVLSICDQGEPFEIVHSYVNEIMPEVSDQQIVESIFNLYDKSIIRFFDIDNNREYLPKERINQMYGEKSNNTFSRGIG